MLGPEMKSTGEVMGISDSFATSFAKSQLASGNRLPNRGKIFISLCDNDKNLIQIFSKNLSKIDFEIVATSGTHQALKSHGVNSTKVLKISQGRPNIEDSIKNGEIALVVNTSDNLASKDDAKILRQSVLRFHIPYFTTIAAANIAFEAIATLKNSNLLEPKALQDFLE